MMRKKEGGGCVSQPGMSVCWECTEPRNPGLSPNLSSHTGTHLSVDQAARGSRLPEAMAKGRSSGARLPGFRSQFCPFLAVRPWASCFPSLCFPYL